MRTAIIVALLSVAACKGKHEKETVIITNAAPNTAAVDPTAPLPAGNPSVATPPSAPDTATPTAEAQPSAPVEAAPTGGTMTQPMAARPSLPDAGIIPDAIDTNGLMPEH